MLPTTTKQTPSKSLAAPLSDWGTEGASSKDMVIPKIVIAQASADVCKEGKAKPGQLIHSQTKAPLAENGAPLTVLPIMLIGTWETTTQKPTDGSFAQFLKSESITPENDDSRWTIEDFMDNQPVVRHKRITVLMLPVNDTEGFPYFMDFKVGNKDAAKAISTIMQENRFKGMPGPSRVITLATKIKKFKNNSWFVTTVVPGRDATPDELVACKGWYDRFKQSEAHAEDNGII